MKHSQVCPRRGCPGAWPGPSRAQRGNMRGSVCVPGNAGSAACQRGSQNRGIRGKKQTARCSPRRHSPLCCLRTVVSCVYKGFVCESTSVGPGKYLPAGPQAAAQLFIDPVLTVPGKCLLHPSPVVGRHPEPGARVPVLLGGQGSHSCRRREGGARFGFGEGVLQLA